LTPTARGSIWRCGQGPARFRLRGSYESPSPSPAHKTYKNGIKALKAIDLEVDEGDFFALLGPNGAGKTTAIGIVTLAGQQNQRRRRSVRARHRSELEVAKSCIGLVPQEINFNMFETCFTIVVNQAGFYGIPRPLAKQRAEKYLKQLQLWERRNSIARSLSGGMKRRLMIARALMHEPKLLILDEPTAGVDIENRRSMWEFLRNINDAGTTIILTTHYLEERRICAAMSRSSRAATSSSATAWSMCCANCKPKCSCSTCATRTRRRRNCRIHRGVIRCAHAGNRNGEDTESQ